MIRIVSALPELRAQVADWKQAGQRIGFVPTMGNLHDGHFSLVRRARQSAGRVVASVFVNPTQFGPDEDFDRYPRTPDADARGLHEAGCDLLWLPSVQTMYPHGVQAAVQVRVPALTDSLEGAHRPGHFDGVASVVIRLFNQVQPDLAVFGRKDYQQLAVIGHLVRELAMPVELIGAETVREADGLALSSRNQYLSAAQRPVAAALHRALQALRSAVMRGAALADAEALAHAALERQGFAVDYVAVRRPDLTAPAEAERGRLVVLAAARLGQTRLIDNLEIDAG